VRDHTTHIWVFATACIVVGLSVGIVIAAVTPFLLFAFFCGWGLITSGLVLIYNEVVRPLEDECSHWRLKAYRESCRE
jgi:hypothetical protein